MLHTKINIFVLLWRWAEMRLSSNTHNERCNIVKQIVSLVQQLQARVGALLLPLDGLPALALRLYLVPVFWVAGMNKFNNFEATVTWFGNPEFGLGLPLPELMAALATSTEMIGAVLLALGLATRWISIPLLVTMLVAVFAVHWPNGWQAISDPSGAFANAQVLASADKIAAARDILQTHGHYDWLTSSGSFAIINNGIEFGVTYAVMLLALMVLGGGRYVSVDYWLARVTRSR